MTVYRFAKKNMNTREFIQHTCETKKIVDQYDVPVMVNDRVDVAIAARAHGVHLGTNDMSILEARKLCSKNYIIGATVHSADEINLAIESGADYVGLGAIFPSPTKPDANTIGTTLFGCVQTINHLAIGGITPVNVGELYTAGCNGIAVSSAISHSKNPEKIVKDLLRAECQPA